MPAVNSPSLAWLDRRWFFPALWLLQLAPLFYNSAPQAPDFARLGLPFVTSGDEPHYLLALHSLLDDGDFDLRNNYDAVNSGGLQAGRRSPGRALDRHIGYYAGDTFVRGSRAADAPQYSTHPPGLPLLLAATLWPWHDSPRLEAYTLIVTALVTCAGAWFFRGLLEHLGAARGRANAVTALLYLATPAWHYGRTLFCEPYLLAAVTTGYCAVLTARPTDRGRMLAGGTVLAIGLLMKPPFVLLALPLGLLLLGQRRIVQTALFAAPLVAATAATLLYHHRYFGSVWHSPQPWSSGNFWIGLRGLFFDGSRGLLIVAPAALLPLLAWPRFARTGGPPALAVLGGGLAYLLLMALWREWHGGFCYGPRLIVPLLPLLFLSLVANPLPDGSVAGRRWLGWALTGLVSVSFLINLGSVVFYRMYGKGVPWERLFN